MKVRIGIENKVWLLASVILLSAAMGGCSKQSYPAEKLEHSLKEICRTEYGVEGVQVQVVENTVGVYLPLEKLFANDFKEAVAKGKVKNIETLFEPSPEAMDKVEDVLFSISRVILSTDLPLQFYTLQATDIESTGLQLVLVGYVDDIKRVRVWDIPRSEYRKRVIHELRLNQAVIWHKPVRKFFDDLVKLSKEQFKSKYTEGVLTPDALEQVLHDVFPHDYVHGDFSKWEIQDIRSTELSQRSAVVYVKLKPALEGKEHQAASKQEPLEYLFVVSLQAREGEISRIIPFQFRNAEGILEQIDFPEELDIMENLSKWNSEFSVTPVSLGTFLAQQLTRRTQFLLAQDERIRNTVREAKLEFEYVEGEDPAHFALNLDARLRYSDDYRTESVVTHEDMRYLLELTSREFVEVLRSYGFGDYGYLQLNLVQDPNPWILGREELELFRRKKIDMQTLLSSLI